jgi:DNA polymerase/3'-5' exonuclease PolX
MRRPGNDELADALERVADLLEAQDANPFRVRAYRRAAGTLRASPEALAERVWREGRAHFTALFSNTARAHELEKTRDWVVVYYERDGEEDQCTV